MKLMERVVKVLDILEKGYPDARVTLDFKDPLQLPHRHHFGRPMHG